MAELTWLLVRGNNRYQLRGRTTDGSVFSTEPGNVTGRSSYKSSGLTGNGLSVAVRRKKGTAAVVTTNTDRKGPLVVRTPVKGGRKKVQAALRAAAEKLGRYDLRRSAFARYEAYHRAQQHSVKKKKKLSKEKKAKKNAKRAAKRAAKKK